MGFALTSCQKNAVNEIAYWYQHGSSQTFVLTGYAGTGKTTLLKYLTQDYLKFKSNEVAFITPTGKAATVLIRKGLPAKTLHRLIYAPREILSFEEVNGKSVPTKKIIFDRVPQLDKEIKLVVLDEASMVSDDMLDDLFSYGVKVLLCGDDAQLPPVNGFNSLILKPNAVLSTIVRQEEDNPIIQLAALCRQGKDIPFGNWNNVAMVMNASDFVGKKRNKLLTAADQVICGTNKFRRALNKDIRNYFGYEDIIVEGEKLICTHSNWNYPVDKNNEYSFVNGLIGYAHDVYNVSKNVGMLRFEPEFLCGELSESYPYDCSYLDTGNYYVKPTDLYNVDGRRVKLNYFDYGYVISCHKSQGSEFNNVVVFDESYCFNEDKNRWLYTAITRAKKKLVLLR